MLSPAQPNIRFVSHDDFAIREAVLASSFDVEGSAGLSVVARYAKNRQPAAIRELQPLDGFERIAALPLVFSLDLASANDAATLLRALRSDPRVLACDVSAEYIVPTISTTQIHTHAIPTTGFENLARTACKFDAAVFPLACEDTPVAVIDSGEPFHERLTGVIQYTGARSTLQSAQPHGRAVAGVLAALPVPVSNPDAMQGCCNAGVSYFNAWCDVGNKSEFDRDVFVMALLSFLASDMRVLNVSIASAQHDEVVAHLFAKAEDLGKTVVCALPATDHPYPAAYDTVVRVGRYHGSTESPTRLFATLSAPGDNIGVLYDHSLFRFDSGSSYAAPAVSAAMWLAARSCPNLCPSDLRDMLVRSVARRESTPHSNIGHGLLDAHALAELVNVHCTCN